MKSFGDYKPPETVGINFQRLAIPHGRELPRAPVQGELFYLDAEIDGKVDRPTFLRGLYHSPGFGWQMFSQQFAKRKASPVGSQNFDVEDAANINNTPAVNQGFQLSAVAIQPEHRLISISGMASFWASMNEDTRIVTSIFRGSKLVAFTVDDLPAKVVRTFSITFLDNPGSTEMQVYTLKVNSTTKGTLYINQSRTLTYDGASQTAFIVSENN